MWVRVGDWKVEQVCWREERSVARRWVRIWTYSSGGRMVRVGTLIGVRVAARQADDVIGVMILPF